jgi:hypothetical protein
VSLNLELKVPNIHNILTGVGLLDACICLVGPPRLP